MRYTIWHVGKPREITKFREREMKRRYSREVIYKRIEYTVLSIVIIVVLFFTGYIARNSSECDPEIIETERVVEVEKTVVEEVEDTESVRLLCRYARIYRNMYWYFTIDGLYRRPGETQYDYDESGELLWMSDTLNDTICR